MPNFPETEWVGAIQANRPLYNTMLTDLTLRERLLLALLRRKGRIVLNDSGPHMQWRVKMSLPTMETYTDGAVIDFGNHNSKLTLALDWRGYIVKDSMTIKQRFMNTGSAMLFNEFSEKQDNIQQAIREGFCGELFKDGEASGRTAHIHGLETFLGAGTVTATDRIALPSDTYGLGAQSTTLQDQGGVWSQTSGLANNAAAGSDWPDGNGTVEYDYLSPKLVNYSASTWGTGNTTFESNAWRVTSAMIDWLTHTGSQSARPDIILYPNDMYRSYKNHQEAKMRINVPHQQANNLGFMDTLNHEGVMIHKDFDCPPGVGYAVNCDYMKVRSIAPQLFYMEGPDRDPHTNWSYVFATGFWGNVEYQPKFFAKTAAYA